MRVAIVAYEGFNELDTFALLHIVNRVTRECPEVHVSAELVCPTETVRTMYGVEVQAQRPLSFACEADAVLISSGGMLAALEDAAFLSQLALDPSRQLIGSQCSGALALARLGLLARSPACIDARYRPHLRAAGVPVLNQPFHATGNVATSGGCFAVAHLAGWVLWRAFGKRAAALALTVVAPVGNEERYVSQVLEGVAPYLPQSDG